MNRSELNDFLLVNTFYCDASTAIMDNYDKLTANNDTNDNTCHIAFAIFVYALLLFEQRMRMI